LLFLALRGERNFERDWGVLGAQETVLGVRLTQGLAKQGAFIFGLLIKHSRLGEAVFFV